MRNHLSPSLRSTNPMWVATLEKQKLANGACMRLEVDWSNSSQISAMDPPVISKAELIFNSTMDSNSKSVESSQVYPLSQSDMEVLCRRQWARVLANAAGISPVKVFKYPCIEDIRYLKLK